MRGLTFYPLRRSLLAQIGAGQTHRYVFRTESELVKRAGLSYPTHSKLQAIVNGLCENLQIIALNVCLAV